MKVFISYRSKERKLVEGLAADLEGFGHDVWFDRELTGGQKWWNEIIENIRACDLFVIALSSGLLRSIPCTKEREYAMALNKRILPVAIAEIDFNLVPTELQVIQTVKYRPQDRDSLLALGKALGALGPAQPLPTPLPTPPEAPVDSLYQFREQLEASTISVEDQLRLWEALDRYLDDPERTESAKVLLNELRQHPDVRGFIAERVEQSLQRLQKPEDVRGFIAERIEQSLQRLQKPEPGPEEAKQSPQIALQPGEREIGSFLIQSEDLKVQLLNPLGQRLIVTNQRLLFHGTGFNREIDIASVQTASKKMVALKPMVSVELTNGEQINFSAFHASRLFYANRDEIIKAIEQAQSA